MSNIIDIFITDREKLLRDALKIVKSIHQAEEIIQDAYFKICIAPRTDVVKNQRSFCYRVVRNLAIDWYRRKKFEDAIFSPYRTQGLQEVHERTPEVEASNTQELSLIVKAIEKLPSRTQRAFEMHYYQGMTQREIVSSLGVSATLVNFMIKEASAQLLSQQPVMAG